MPILRTSLIGNYEFLRMTPPPPAMRLVGHVEQRAGLNDHTFWRTSFIGVPWNCETFADTNNIDFAHQLFRGYEGLIFSDPQTFVYDGIVAPVTDRVFVLDVRPLEIHETLAASGGLTRKAGGGSPGAFVRAQWTLIATQVPPPE